MSELSETPQTNDARRQAQDLLNWPSMLMLMTGALGMMWSIAQLLTEMLTDTAQFMEQVLRNVPEEQREALLPLMNMRTTTSGIFFSLLSIASNAFLLWAALQMRELKNWNVAVAASVLLVIPCHCCYCISIPAGIWALVVLLRPDVKAVFMQGRAPVV
jgi:hypothetical protein